MQRLLCYLLLLALLPSFAGASPEPHGKRYRAAEPSPPSEGDALPREASPRDLADLTKRLLQLSEQEELERGPYSDRLSETLDELARVYEARGLFAEAQRYRDRALHLIRVNDGLYSPRQGPLVRATLSSLRERELFADLDARYTYFFRLYGAGRPPFDDVRWAATLEYLRWQREAYLREIDPDPRRRLLDLYAQHQALSEVLAGTQPVDAARLRDATLSFLQTLYLFSDLEPPRDLALTLQGERVRRDDPLQFDPLRERLENLQRTLRNRGRSAIEDALAVIPATESEVQAELNLALADWLLWQGATGSALRTYTDLLDRVRGTELAGRVQSWFAVPTPLPQPDAFRIPAQPASPARFLSLTVTDTGRAIQIEADGGEGPSPEFNRLRRYLRDSRFRPAYRDGAFVDFTGWETRWELLDD